MTEEPLHSTELDSQQEEKLRDLTSQSWNLELVISGAAMFAILQLPDLLDVAFGYFRFNMLSHTTGMLGLLPSMVYSIMKAICYVLFAAFLTNFVMRAFWVGLVGLLSVYPTGIHYDRIPFTPRYTQEKMAARFGSLQNYIINLDRRCNIVFAVSFLIVFIFIIVALGYVVGIIGYTVIRPMIPDQYAFLIKVAAIGLLIVYMAAATILSLPAVRSTPRGAELHYRFSNLLRFLYWGLSKPFGFIINTFYSHIPSKKMLRVMGMMTFLFIIVMIVNFFTDFTRQNKQVSVLNTRFLYSARYDSLFVKAESYDDKRAEGTYIETASVQSDVIREPFIRLFVAYPKALDTLLTELTTALVLDGSRPVQERRRKYATWSSEQINKLMQIRINDSLYTDPKLLFTLRENPGQQGWQTVLFPKNLKTGQNYLNIVIQPLDKQKPTEIATIPFWYSAE
ncbi:hypothetical protein DSL64_00015 [Dyadobacter luteus]|jgi:hypothetical protein|uniref:Uncharacterized protein n=1 Tax=Dyadobacter luteus TaxID=2259619 RepID=A0A3D8YGP9_9BACT|nr:hypothetical protein [Dyadobacter luteus]REA63996.1 hypothetical protein DSL64_00015 [Dyadobacter luteus]